MPRGVLVQPPRVSISMSRIVKFIPFIIALVFLTAFVAVILFKSEQRTEGHLIYALDDPYIHMAMAKNMARFGVWGVTRYEFSSSSSAPLWTFLLSVVYFVFGVNELAPFVLAFASALAVLVILFWISRTERLNSLGTTILLCGMVLVVPLPTLVFVGQEHALHLCLTLLVAYLAARILGESASPKMPIVLCALVPFLVLTRYEGLFLVGAVALLFFIRRRWVLAVSCLALAVLPLVIYGGISVWNGWNWLPNSILLKSALPTSLGAVVQNAWQQIATVPALGGLLLFSIFALVLNSRRPFWRISNVLSLLFIITSLMHVTFARVGWFYRYEAYLMGFGWVSCGIAFIEIMSRLRTSQPRAKFALGGIVLLVVVAYQVFLIGDRSFNALRFIPMATENIYEQQYQMGSFVRRYYTGGTIIANDIGAISYLADVHLIDVVGLATRYTAERQLAHAQLEGDDLAAYAAQQGVNIALLYDSLYTSNGTNHLPTAWTRLAQWTIQDKIVVGDTTIAIYATSEQEKTRLQANLHDFAPSLPRTVIQQGDYLP